MPLVPPESRRVIRDETGSQKLVGYVVDLTAGDGHGRCYLDLGPQHLNRHGMLHGGISTMLLDSACGFTATMAFDPEKMSPVLTVSLATQYVAPVGDGRVTATGTVAGHGRSVCHVTGELRAEDGRLIATATGVFKRVRRAGAA